LIAQASPNLAPGNYDVVITSVSSSGNYSIVYSLNVAQPPRNLQHDVTVVVRDIYGIPVSGASVILNEAGSSASAETKGSGTVVFHLVPAGAYNVTVSYFGGSSVLSGDSNSPELDVIVVLSPPVAITGIVFVLIIAAFLSHGVLKRTSTNRHFYWEV
jgi:hypothetical protein